MRDTYPSPLEVAHLNDSNEGSAYSVCLRVRLSACDTVAARIVFLIFSTYHKDVFQFQPCYEIFSDPVTCPPRCSSLALSTPCTPRPGSYVHTLIKGTPDMANSFAQQHGLTKLAQSLEPYWSRGSALTAEEETRWEECVLSLLEVTSSVALMTSQRNILTVLDERFFGGVAEVRTTRCRRVSMTAVGRATFLRRNHIALGGFGGRGTWKAFEYDHIFASRTLTYAW